MVMYIMSHEVGLFSVVFGMLLFIVLATTISEDIALRYAILIVATLQLLSCRLQIALTNNRY